jgi:glyoxylase-like metal-dependent hydrolase (beta-lactamase superfamily II)
MANNMKDSVSKATDQLSGRDHIPQQLAEGLWLLGNQYFNLYLVRGQQASALIEIGVSAIADKVIHQLDKIGVQPSFLVITHPHPDHITGIDTLRDRYRDALVIAADSASEFLSAPHIAESFLTEDTHMTEFLRSVGVFSKRPPLNAPPHLRDHLLAHDGNEIDLGGRTLRFIEARGHSPGCINVFIPEIKALCASDSLGYRFPKRGFFPLFFTGFDHYMKTLLYLQSLKPDILCLGHQGPLMGKDLIESSFREASDRAVSFRDNLRRGKDTPDADSLRLFHEWYTDEFHVYTPENILECCKLLVKRARQG